MKKCWHIHNPTLTEDLQEWIAKVGCREIDNIYHWTWAHIEPQLNLDSTKNQLENTSP